MTGDCHDLSVRAAQFSEAGGSCFAQAMSAALGQFGLVAPVAHLVPEAGIRERSIQVVDEECQVPGLGRVYRRLQGRNDGYLEGDRLSLASLELGEGQDPVTNMLAANRMTSDRRWQVYRSRSNASLALVPVGCFASNCSTSASVHAWMPSALPSR